MASYTNMDVAYTRPSTGLTAPAAWGDTVHDNFNYLYGDSGWTNITAFTASWAAFAGSTPRYRKVGSLVYVQGKIGGGTIGSTAAFNLPTGYRPGQTQSFATIASGSIVARVEVLSTGDVEVVAGSSTWTAIDLSFCVL